MSTTSPPHLPVVSMFEPTNRFMLVDALRPPPGHTLSTAVGTSFTLDLDALLLATLSFAVADRLDTEDGRPDPIAMLESVRRHADNILSLIHI